MDCRYCSVSTCPVKQHCACESRTLFNLFGKEKSIKKGAMFFREGEKIRNVCILKNGLLKISGAKKGGEENIIRLVRPSGVFGFYGKKNIRWDVSVIAVENSIACMFPLDFFHKLIMQNNKLAYHLYLQFNQDISKTEQCAINPKKHTVSI